MYRILTFALFATFAGRAIAQASDPLEFTVGPTLGYHIPFDRLAGPAGSATAAFGGRLRLVRSSSQAFYVEVSGRSQSDDDSYSYGWSGYANSRRSQRIIGTAGIVSTFLHPDGARLFAANAVVGIGFISDSSRGTYRFYDRYGSREGAGKSSTLSPLLNVGMEAEVPLTSHISAHAGLGALLGLDVGNRREGLIWYPGLTLSAGIGFSN